VWRDAARILLARVEVGGAGGGDDVERHRGELVCCRRVGWIRTVHLDLGSLVVHFVVFSVLCSVCRCGDMLVRTCVFPG
jgi:hypothetical protein